MMNAILKRSTLGTVQLIGLVAATFLTSTASAQTDLIAIEFNEDDHPDFDIWPSTLGGTNFSSATFGGITVDVSTNTSFAMPTNRGSVDGNPPGYSYQHLYEDLLHAFTPTGTLTIDFGGLAPDTDYVFTLYAWDPGSSGTHEWTITQGTSVPPVITVDWSVPLVDNDTFALVFNVTTTSTGTFSVDNTAGLGGSAMNGFRLSGHAGLGTNYCAVNANSTGAPAIMDGDGSLSIVDNDLTVGAQPVPTQPGIFFYANNQAQIPFGEGFLCAVGTIVRFSPGMPNGDRAERVVDLPSSGITTASTLYFQYWFRDPAGGGTFFNTSDGLELVFTP